MRHPCGHRSDADGDRHPGPHGRRDPEDKPVNTLILYIGNPILTNDRIGLVVGQSLYRCLGGRRGFTLREFTGSPLDLFPLVEGFDRLILIDSIVSKNLEVGTVAVFREKEILSFSRTFYPHGLNLAEVFALSRKLDLPLPAQTVLVGIEVGEIGPFGESLSPALAAKLPAIEGEVLRVIDELSPQPAG